jgi:hypothetical protein
MVAGATGVGAVEGYTAEGVALAAEDSTVVEVPAPEATTVVEDIPVVPVPAADIAVARMEVCAEGQVRALVHRDPGLRTAIAVRATCLPDFILLVEADLARLENDLPAQVRAEDRPGKDLALRLSRLIAWGQITPRSPTGSGIPLERLVLQPVEP